MGPEMRQRSYASRNHHDCGCGYGYGGRAFAYVGPTSWNSLPDSLKDINLTLQILKRHLKTFLFSTY